MPFKVFAYALAIVLAIVLAVLAAGLSNLSFYLWPTTWGDRTLAVTPHMLNQLRALRQERKFEADRKNFYFGAPDELQRAIAQRHVDFAIDALLDTLPAHPHRAVVLGIFKQTLAQIDTPESEERDQTLVYLSRIATVCGVDSTGELLNVWRYGFPYGWIAR